LKCLDRSELLVDPEDGCGGLVVESSFGGIRGGMEKEE
jgi:hypothetical protein